MGLGHCDNINRMITLSVITLSGFHCICELNDQQNTVCFTTMKNYLRSSTFNLENIILLSSVYEIVTWVVVHSEFETQSPGKKLKFNEQTGTGKTQSFS
jgi:hypothetical protein